MPETFVQLDVPIGVIAERQDKRVDVHRRVIEAGYNVRWPLSGQIEFAVDIAAERPWTVRCHGGRDRDITRPSVSRQFIVYVQMAVKGIADLPGWNLGASSAGW